MTRRWRGPCTLPIRRESRSLYHKDGSTEADGKARRVRGLGGMGADDEVLAVEYLRFVAAKTAASWTAWNSANPLHPRGPDGQFVDTPAWLEALGDMPAGEPGRDVVRRAVDLPPLRIRPELAALRTKAQVERYLGDNLERILGREVPVNLGTRMHATTMRELAEGLLSSAENWPETRVERVSVASRLPGAAPDGWSTTVTGPNGGPEIVLNERQLGDRTRFLTRLRRTVESGDRRVTADNAAYVAAHEFGHVAAREHLGAPGGTRQHDVVLGVLGHMRDQGVDVDSQGELNAYFSGHLGSYAMHSQPEMAAEGFADVILNGEDASPLSLQIVRATRRAMGDPNFGEPEPQAGTPAQRPPAAGHRAQDAIPVRWSYASRSAETGLEGLSTEDRAAISEALTDWVYDKPPDNPGLASEPYVNAALRGRADMTPERQRTVELIDRALTLSRIDEPVTVYRGYQNGRGVLPDDWQTRDLTGHTWENRGFTPTTDDLDAAETYAGSVEDQGFAIRVMLPSGAHAVAIQDERGGLDDGGEIILPRDLDFRVVRDRGIQGDYGIRWLDVELSPRAARPSTRRTRPSVRLRIAEALNMWATGQGPEAPLDGFEREPLRLVARDYGLQLRRGATVEDIRAALLDHTRGTVRDRRAAEPGLRSLADMLDNMESVRDEQIRAAFEGDFGGLHTKVTSWNRSYSGALMVEGEVLDSRGHRVGTIAQDYYRDRRRNGEIVAHHGYMSLDASVQGSGFATAFGGHLLTWYKASGVAELHTMADIDVGGYTWARGGFNWATTEVARTMISRLRRFVNSLDDPRTRMRGAPDLAEQARIGRDLLDRAAFARTLAEFPTAYEISQLGRWDGAGKDDMWIGKRTLLGSNWDAVLKL